jgi:hypothetical protein
MAGKHQPNKDRISLFCHNKVQKPYLTRYSVIKFNKVTKNGNKNCYEMKVFNDKFNNF